MTSAHEIRDKDSLQAWLDGRDRSDAVTVALRAALRVAPVYWSWIGSPYAKDDLTELPICRSLLISGVAAVGPTPAISRAAAAAAEAAAANANAAAAYDGYCAHAAAAYAAAYAYADFAAYAYAAADAYAYATNGEADAYALSVDAFWAEMRAECVGLEQGEDLLHAPLWPEGMPAGWPEPHKAWPDRGAAWRFWHDWYEGCLTGDLLPAGLLEKVALIAPEVWDASEAAVSARIEEILSEHEAGTDDLSVDRALSRLDPPSQKAVQTVKSAMERNRHDLPPTFDAVLGFIALEVERLQTRNYRDEDDARESACQIRVLTLLHDAVSQLKALVPKTGEMPKKDAEKAEKLTRLYVRKFGEWPRANADELVDSTCRMALVGATTAMLPMVGVTGPYALGAALVMFGGKSMVEAAKAAKDLWKGG